MLFAVSISGQVLETVQDKRAVKIKHDSLKETRLDNRRVLETAPDSLGLTEKDIIRFETRVHGLYRYGLTDDGMRAMSYYIEYSFKSYMLNETLNEKVVELTDDNNDYKYNAEQFDKMLIKIKSKNKVQLELSEAEIKQAETRAKMYKLQRNKAYAMTGAVAVAAAVLVVLLAR